MIGMVPELTDPKLYNNGSYPNAWFVPDSQGGAQPSISSRRLYIPLNIWFTLASKMAFPLVSLQYNILQIELDCRPIQELFVIRDVLNHDVLSGTLDPLEAPYIRADQNIAAYQFYRFIQTPPDEIILTNSSTQFPSKRTDWFADIHLNSTYAFLGDEEVKLFAANPQSYLIKEVHETKFHNVTGNQKIQLYSLGLVANWMWFFQRDDINLRNQWSNYTNWLYNNIIPYPPTKAPLTVSGTSSYIYDAQVGSFNGFNNFKDGINWGDLGATISNVETVGPGVGGPSLYGPRTQPNGLYAASNINITGRYRPENQRDIMLQWALLLDGK